MSKEIPLEELLDAFFKIGEFGHVTLNMGRNGPVIATRSHWDSEYSRDTLRGQSPSQHLRNALENALGAKNRPVKRRLVIPPKVTDFDDILGI